MEAEGVAVATAAEQAALVFFCGPLNGSIFVAGCAEVIDAAIVESSEAWRWTVRPVWLRSPTSDNALSSALTRATTDGRERKRQRTKPADVSANVSEREHLRAAKVAAARSLRGNGVRCIAAQRCGRATSRGDGETCWMLAAAGDDKILRVFRGKHIQPAQATDAAMLWETVIEK